jgi:hypothetical protein
MLELRRRQFITARRRGGLVSVRLATFSASKPTQRNEPNSMTFNSIHRRSSEVSRAKILALSLVAAFTLGSGALAQAAGAGGGGAGGGASGAGSAAGGSGAGSAAGASGAHGAGGGSSTPGTGNPNSPVSVQPPGSTGQNTINSPGTGAGPGPNPGPPNK